MNLLSKTLAITLGMALFTFASADRTYFLVGTRHVYRIGSTPYAHVEERRAIEQAYADQVAEDQDQYNRAIDGGASPDAEGPEFNRALSDLALERDRRLSALYENVDFERIRHPELQIEGDGPYQVIAMNFHLLGEFQIIDSFSVSAPWPGYAVVDPPYGWTYDVVYTPTVFVNVYAGWHRVYVEDGCPAFYGFVGREHVIHVEGIYRGDRGVITYHNYGHGDRTNRNSKYNHDRDANSKRYSNREQTSRSITGSATIRSRYSTRLSNHEESSSFDKTRSGVRTNGGTKWNRSTYESIRTNGERTRSSAVRKNDVESVARSSRRNPGESSGHKTDSATRKNRP